MPWREVWQSMASLSRHPAHWVRVRVGVGVGVGLRLRLRGLGSGFSL